MIATEFALVPHAVQQGWRYAAGKTNLLSIVEIEALHVMLENRTGGPAGPIETVAREAGEGRFLVRQYRKKQEEPAAEEKPIFDYLYFPNGHSLEILYGRDGRKKQTTVSILRTTGAKDSTDLLTLPLAVIEGEYDIPEKFPDGEFLLTRGAGRHKKNLFRVVQTVGSGNSLVKVNTPMSKNLYFDVYDNKQPLFPHHVKYKLDYSGDVPKLVPIYRRQVKEDPDDRTIYHQVEQSFDEKTGQWRDNELVIAAHKGGVVLKPENVTYYRHGIVDQARTGKARQELLRIQLGDNLKTLGGRIDPLFGISRHKRAQKQVYCLTEKMKAA